MKCPNCGAMLDDSMPKCPYCQTMHFPGAEKEYMGELHKLRDDLEDLEDIPMDTWQDTLKTESTRTGKRIAIFVLVLLAIGLSVFGVSHFRQKQAEEAAALQLAWERQAFPKLDTWYEAGDYDAILDYLSEDPDAQNYSIFRWKHSDFIWAYSDYQYILNEDSTNDRSVKLSLAFLLFYTDTQEMPEADRQKVLEYQESAKQLLTERYHMTLEELQAFYDEEVKK